MSDTPAEKPDIQCPKCGERFYVNAVAHLSRHSDVVFKLRPGEREFFNAKNLGGAIEQMGKLLIACAKDQGMRAEVLVTDIKRSEDGEFAVYMRITRFDPKVRG